MKYMKLAMEHVDRMTERERYRNRGLYYHITGDWQNCVQEYTQLVTRYPADRVGQNNLANLLYAVAQRAQGTGSGANTQLRLSPRAWARG